MRNIKEYLCLTFVAGLSHNKIARVMELSNSVVSKYVTTASKTGLG
jgi:DNA-binding transcriptional regulator LsrR (DeoR family)